MLFDPSLSSISALQEATPVLSSEPGAGESLESRVMNALANMSAGFEADRANIVHAVKDFDPTDAASSVELQTQLAKYSTEVSYVATLARKSVAAVEALLR